ncbi:CoA-transferase [Chloroflexota bacterium]
MVAVKRYTTDCSVPEMLACFISHEFEDGEEIGVGANLPIPRAASFLAHMTHAPNTVLILSYGKTSLPDVSVLGPLQSAFDFRKARWAEYYDRDEDMVTEAKRVNRGRFFIGALQVDKYGNSNLIGIGDNHSRLNLRGPGAVGTTSMTCYAKCYYIMLNSHNKCVFVEECDYISAVGWGEGGIDGRKKLALPGGGPKYVLTPICIMDFEEMTKRMRLRSVHPGITIKQVVANTGFELIIPDRVTTTEAVSEEELQLLRNRIDVDGVLRK